MKHETPMPRPFDEVVVSFPPPRSQDVADRYRTVAGRRLTLREMALRHGQSVGCPQILGTPAQVADQLEAYFDPAYSAGSSRYRAVHEGCLFAIAPLAALIRTDHPQEITLAERRPIHIDETQLGIGHLPQ